MLHNYLKKEINITFKRVINIWKTFYTELTGLENTGTSARYPYTGELQNKGTKEILEYLENRKAKMKSVFEFYRRHKDSLSLHGEPQNSKEMHTIDSILAEEVTFFQLLEKKSEERKDVMNLLVSFLHVTTDLLRLNPDIKESIRKHDIELSKLKEELVKKEAEFKKTEERISALRHQITELEIVIKDLLNL